MLDDIIQNRKIEIAEQKNKVALTELRSMAEKMSRTPRFSFLNALSKDGINIIAEIKKASPSKGLICEEFDAVRIAREYERGGAAAISVLTEQKYFQGDIRYLDSISKQVKLPLLRKDFIIDEYQIYEAAVYHASAVLLITVCLSKQQLEQYIILANSLGLDSLVEVHNVVELEKVLDTSAKIIGVNNRDLKSFKVDLQTSCDLMQYMPKDKVTVSESGIFTFQDINLLKDAGFNAFLIGESLMRKSDRVKALLKLLKS